MHGPITKSPSSGSGLDFWGQGVATVKTEVPPSKFQMLLRQILDLPQLSSDWLATLIITNPTERGAPFYFISFV